MYVYIFWYFWGTFLESWRHPPLIIIWRDPPHIPPLFEVTLPGPEMNIEVLTSMYS